MERHFDFRQVSKTSLEIFDRGTEAVVYRIGFTHGDNGYQATFEVQNSLGVVLATLTGSGVTFKPGTWDQKATTVSSFIRSHLFSSKRTFSFNGQSYFIRHSTLFPAGPKAMQSPLAHFGQSITVFPSQASGSHALFDEKGLLTTLFDTALLAFIAIAQGKKPKKKSSSGTWCGSSSRRDDGTSIALLYIWSSDVGSWNSGGGGSGGGGGGDVLSGIAGGSGAGNSGGDNGDGCGDCLAACCGILCGIFSGCD